MSDTAKTTPTFLSNHPHRQGNGRQFNRAGERETGRPDGLTEMLFGRLPQAHTGNPPADWRRRTIEAFNVLTENDRPPVRKRQPIPYRYLKNRNRRPHPDRQPERRRTDRDRSNHGQEKEADSHVSNYPNADFAERKNAPTTYADSTGRPSEISVADSDSTLLIQGLAVHSDVVKALCEWRPVLRDKDAFLRFAVVLLKRPFVGDSGRQLLSEPIVRRVFGQSVSYQGAAGRESVEELLQAFKDAVDPLLQWTDWNSEAGYCRECITDGIPEELRELEREKAAKIEAEQRFVESGNILNGKSRMEYRNEQKRHAESYDPATGPPEDSRRWARYMNARSPRTFSALWENYAEAWHAAGKLPNEAARRQAESYLKRLTVQPMPVYRYSDNSARIVAPGSAQSIQAEIRQILYLDARWVELDLSKAQLAIAAHDWGDLPPTSEILTEQLAGNFDVWTDLAEHCQQASSEPLDPKALRATVKRGTYAAVYGGGKTVGVPSAMRQAYRAETRSKLDAAAVRAFTRHPMITEVLEAREWQFKKIRANGGLFDCFGRWISVEGLDRDRPERSVLAQAAQARELWLMRPILELAEAEEERARPRWEIVLYQYDGVTVRVRDKRRIETRIKEITEAANRHAKAAGYLTRLEVA